MAAYLAQSLSSSSSATLPKTSIKLPDAPEEETGGLYAVDLDEIIHIVGAIASKAGLASVWVMATLSLLSVGLGGWAAKCGLKDCKEANENAPQLYSDLKSSEEVFDKLSKQKSAVEKNLKELLDAKQACDAASKYSVMLGQTMQQMRTGQESALIPLLSGLRITSEDVAALTIIVRENLEQEQSAAAKKLEKEQVAAIVKLEEQLAWLLSQKLSAQENTATILSSLQMNRDNKGIGVNTLGSGAIISSKGLMELAVLLKSFIASNTFGIASLSMASLSLANVIATASTLALTPAAAICAVALGAYFIHKSIHLKDARQAGRQAFNELLKDPSIDIENPLVNEYLKQVGETITKGEKFDRNFLWSNIAFLSSTVIYTLWTIADAVLTGAGLLGLTTLSLPMAPFWAVAIVGSVMLLSSLSFLYGHEQQKDNDNDRAKGAPHLDRDYHAIVDRMLNKAKGVESRADLLECYKKGEEARQAFLEQFQSPRPFKKSVKLFDASLTYEAAHRPKPTQDSVQKWLATPKGHQALVKFMQETLEAQKAYLEKKNAVLQEMSDVNGSSNGEEIPSIEENRSLQEKISFLKIKDSNLAVQIDTLLTSIEGLPQIPELLNSKEFADIKKCFIYCQKAELAIEEVNAEEAEKIEKEEQSPEQLLVEHYLLKESYGTLLRRLVETEFQANRLGSAKERTPAEDEAIKKELEKLEKQYGQPEQQTASNQPVYNPAKNVALCLV